MPYDEVWFPEPYQGQGSLHDLSDPDPRNPRLIGMRSVSYAGAVGLANVPKPVERRIGFHLPRGSSQMAKKKEEVLSPLSPEQTSRWTRRTGA